MRKKIITVKIKEIAVNIFTTDHNIYIKWYVLYKKNYQKVEYNLLVYDKH